MAEATPDRVLDCSGLRCPIPLVKTNKVMKELQVGQILEMISTDPGSVLDVDAWSKQTLHEVLSVRQGEHGEYHFIIRKKS